MNYPKFIEFQSGHFIIFCPSLSHAQMAKGAALDPVSAGLCCANRTTNGKFFGCSTTLNMDANKSLSLGRQKLFVGDLYGNPIVSTSDSLLSEIGVKSVQPATMELVGDYFIPVSACFSVERMNRFLEP